jgi:hypothetical protein
VAPRGSVKGRVVTNWSPATFWTELGKWVRGPSMV